MQVETGEKIIRTNKGIIDVKTEAEAEVEVKAEVEAAVEAIVPIIDIVHPVLLHPDIAAVAIIALTIFVTIIVAHHHHHHQEDVIDKG